MKQTDLLSVAALAEQAHPQFPEDPKVFAEKQRLFEPFCFTLEFGSAIAGYCIAHPWMRDKVPVLNRLLGAAPQAPDCLFIHDVAVAPAARGKGATTALMESLTAAAQSYGLNAITLVALYGSNKMWNRYGFHAVAIEKTEIKSYGPSAIYMLKSVNSHPRA